MNKTLDQLKYLCVHNDIALPQGEEMFDDEEKTK